MSIVQLHRVGQWAAHVIVSRTTCNLRLGCYCLLPCVTTIAPNSVRSHRGQPQTNTLQCDATPQPQTTGLLLAVGHPSEIHRTLGKYTVQPSCRHHFVPPSPIPPRVSHPSPSLPSLPESPIPPERHPQSHTACTTGTTPEALTRAGGRG